MGKLRIEYVPIDKIRPYDNNPRLNEEAIPLVRKSIEDFGFQVPMVLDKDLVVVTGHTRLEAAKELGMDFVPCIIAKELTPEQIKAYRIVDNKVSEAAGWNWDLLQDELSELSDFGFDMGDFGFIDYDAIDDMPLAPDDRPREDDGGIEFMDDPAEGLRSPDMGGGRKVTVFCDSDDDVALLKNMLNEIGFRYR